MLCVSLSAITLAVYLPVHGFDFVNYDDGAYVTENAHVKTGLSWTNVRWAFSFKSSLDTGNWHPLTWLSLMADVSLFGQNAGRLHLVNVVIHVGNVLLVFIVMLKATGVAGRSAFVAAVFAVHPLHVESVAWISERKDVLSTFFALLTLWAHLNFLQQSRRSWQLTALFFFTVSLMCKQMYVTLPCVMLLMDVWPLKRITIPESDTTTPNQISIRQLLSEKAPFFFLAVLFSIVAFLGQRHGGAVGTLEEYSLTQRMLNGCISYVVYLWKTVVPVNLAVFYPYPTQALWIPAGLSAAFLAVMTVTAVRQRDRFPELLVGWLWYLGTLVPVIGIVQIGRQSMADRYMYFPMIGLLAAVTWFVSRAADADKVKFFRAAGIGLILLLAVMARRQVMHWRNSLDLFSRAAAVAPSSLAYTKLGYERAQLREFDAAANLLNRALRLDTEYVAAHTSLANVLLLEGQPQEAIVHFKRAIELEPGHAEAHYNLGLIYTKLGELTEARKHYESALLAAPDNPQIHTNLAIACIMQKQESQALIHLEAALRIDNDLPEALFAIGNLLASLERTEEAVVHLKKLLLIRPDSSSLHLLLASLYEQLGKPSLARSHRERAEETGLP